MAVEDDNFHYLTGNLNFVQAGPLWARFSTYLNKKKPREFNIDLHQVTGIDTAGVALLVSLERLCAALGVQLNFLQIPETLTPFYNFLKENSSCQPLRKPKSKIDFMTRWGRTVQQYLQDTYDFVSFLGKFLITGPKQLLHMRWLHLREFLYQTQLTGVGALPLLTSLSILLGALMVFQGMKGVTQFGATIYIADMVVFAVTREMAPLLTAVILAGRSGAAFAAEIGTMKINEEIDALTVHNFDVMSYLVLPRVFALIVSGPLLTIISDAVGILGGMITSSLTLDLPAASFLQETQKVLSASDINTGLIKGAVFGACIGLIGCFRGLQTGSGGNSVGIQTTSAVVTGIFTVIFLDTLFSYIFQIYRV